MDNLKEWDYLADGSDNEVSVMRQDDNGKSWYVRVEDVVSNRIEVPPLEGEEWYEPDSTVVDSI